MKLNTDKPDVSISIIVPIYNASEYLEKCINSVLNQSYKDFELILVDDGSTDESYKICTIHAEKDERIKVLWQKNRGPSAARNLGLEHARGEYIRFIDADDCLSRDSLEMLIAPFESTASTDMVIGSFASNDAFYMENLAGEYPIEFLLDKFIPAVTSFYYGVVWNKLYRAELIKKYDIKFNEEIHWSEDFLFNLMYFSHCSKVYYIPQSVYNYYSREDSLCNSVEKYPDDDKYRIEIIRYQEVRKLISQKKSDIELEKIVIDYLIHIVHWYLDIILQEPDSRDSKMKRMREVLTTPVIVEAVNSKIYSPTAIDMKGFVFLVKRKSYRLIILSYSIQNCLKTCLKQSVIIKNFMKKLRGNVSTFPF